MLRNKLVLLGIRCCIRHRQHQRRRLPILQAKAFSGAQSVLFTEVLAG